MDAPHFDPAWDIDFFADFTWKESTQKKTNRAAPEGLSVAVLPPVLMVGQISAPIFEVTWKTHKGLSENSVPNDPMVNDHYPY